MSSNPQVTIGVTATDTASKVLSNVDNAVQRTTSNVESQGNKIESKTAKISNAVKTNLTHVVTSMATLGAGIVSFATSFDTLEKAQVRAEQATLTYNKAQARLEELQKSGKASADQIARAQETVAIAGDKMRLAQDGVTDTYTNFLATVPLQILGFGTSLIGMLTAAGVTSGTLTSALGVLKAAMISTFITNPVGIAILGISALVAVLVFNVGGLRDMMFSAGAAVIDFLRKFTPLGIAIEFFINNVLKPLGVSFDESVPKAAEQSTQAFADIEAQATDTASMLGDFTTQAELTQTNLQVEMPSASAIAKASLIDIATATTDTGNEIDTLSVTATQAMQSLSTSFESAASDVTKSTKRMSNAINDLIKDLKQLRKLQNDTGVSRGSGSGGNNKSSSSASEEKKRTTTLKATSQSVRGVGI